MSIDMQPTTPTVPAKPRRRWILTTTIALATLIIGIAIGSSGESTGTTTDTSPPATVVTDAGAEPAVPPAGPDYYEPEAGDFELTVKTLSKECFGSAGCLIDFRIELAITKTGVAFDPGITYELTYEVTGGDSEYINTLTIDGDEYSTDESESISTPSDRDLTVKVLDVSEI
jgi:hypothetical protein